ncbi:NAD(P)/FAD-dependent oxidoreductase [Rubellimicrobium aerolatum]|uniref:NAD(P)/FAD-dependent oxidoreductase n=1 Tax=Rubellimicrobium aerolatum TaxID=490979 RepID=A0ABW0S8P8_9RHOB|nr:NAD(P)/FAD-dependent oxidoreductase [Rubellimicrobium aerolatum]MBP1804211.1 L-2-hydroxyglutarate oxidase LhgO [Rubellimicrobium aerolatum]
MDDLDALIVGGGAVGIACALALARRGRSVLIAESEPLFGSMTSSRNSEVIHAGLYYPPGSLKARLCVRGRDLLYAFCADRGVPHRQLGKIVFAHDEGERPALERIARRAADSGAGDLAWLDRRDIARLEPALPAVAALLSPRTGILDSHAYMTAMLGEVEARGGQIVCGARVAALRRSGDAWSVFIEGEAEPVLSARQVVNAAGLGAQELAARTEGFDPSAIPARLLVPGCYFGYSGPVPFRHLIYPVPVPGGLGTHLTLDLAGRAKFGPNVRPPIEAEDYVVDPAQHDQFAAAARRIWPGLDADLLVPAYAGLRPKVAVPPGQEPDFVISDAARHGCPGLVALFGIESPGLTASLAIGEEVAERLELGPGATTLDTAA